MYSFALILYFLLALDRKTDPYLLSQFDVTSPTAHKSELMHLTNKLNRSINCYESEIQDIMRMILLSDSPRGRGNLGNIVSRQFF